MELSVWTTLVVWGLECLRGIVKAISVTKAHLLGYLKSWYLTVVEQQYNTDFFAWLYKFMLTVPESFLLFPLFSASQWTLVEVWSLGLV